MPDGTLDSNWDPQADQPIYALAVDSDDAVYAGGQFFHIGGLERAGLAKLSGIGNGSADAGWDTAAYGAANFNIYALTIGSDGSVYAGGFFFFTLNGDFRTHLAKFSGTTGSLDTNWNPSPDHAVLALSIGPDDAVYAGGVFQTIGGLVSNYIAKLDGSGVGAADAGWNLSMNGYATALLSDGNDSLYVAGGFVKTGGSVARVSLTTPATVDANWNSPISGNVRAMALAAGSALFVGGDVCSNCVPVAFLERIPLAGDGTPDPRWQPEPDGPVHALAMGAGGILVGGDFALIGGSAREAIAVLPENGSEDIFADDFDG